LSAGLLTGGLWWRHDEQLGMYKQLPTLVDTIIPADQYPGALATGVMAVVLKQMHSNQIIERLYQQGLTVLSKILAKRGFASLNSLDQRQRESILHELQNDSLDGLKFVNHLIEVVMVHYYSSRTGYASLNYVPPVELVEARAAMSQQSCG